MFRMLDQNILGLVTQARTGHRHFREYYTTHNIQEPSSCPCGAETQTHDHILFKCEIHEEHRYLIDEGAPDHKLMTILGTKKGINALAKFVRASKAFQKQKAWPIP